VYNVLKASTIVHRLLKGTATDMVYTIEQLKDLSVDDIRTDKIILRREISASLEQLETMVALSFALLVVLSLETRTIKCAKQSRDRKFHREVLLSDANLSVISLLLQGQTYL
jgi:hypothetical protein